MKKLGLLAFGIGLFLLGACSSTTGNAQLENAQAVQSWLVDGQTTQAQVKAKLGDPDNVREFKGDEMWVYRYRHTQMDAWLIIGVGHEQVNKRTLRIVFGKDQVVKKYWYSKQDHSKFVGE